MCVCVCLFARECVCVYEIHAHNPVTAKTEKYLLILNLIILMCQFKQDTIRILFSLTELSMTY